MMDRDGNPDELARLQEAHGGLYGLAYVLWDLGSNRLMVIALQHRAAALSRISRRVLGIEP